MPIRTCADWDEIKPALFGADLAAHCCGTAAGALASRCSWLRLAVKLFRLSLKLRKKMHRGAKVARRHDDGDTPRQRLTAAGVLNDEDHDELQRMFPTLNPADIATVPGGVTTPL